MCEQVVPPPKHGHSESRDTNDGVDTETVALTMVNSPSGFSTTSDFMVPFFTQVYGVSLTLFNFVCNIHTAVITDSVLAWLG